MLRSNVACDMKPSFPPTPRPTTGLPESLHGQVRAIKDASGSSSYTDSESDLGAPGDARHSSLAGHGEESSHDDSDEDHEQGGVSHTLSRPRLRRKS